MARLVEQGDGEGVALRAAAAEHDQILLGLGGHGGHRITASQGLQGHRQGGGLALLKAQQVFRAGARAGQIHRHAGQGLLGADRQGDATGPAGDHEIVATWAQTTDGGGVVVVAPLVEHVVLHQLPRRRPLGGLTAEDQLVVVQVDARTGGDDRHGLDLIDGVLVAGGAAGIQLQGCRVSQGEAGAAIGGAGAIAVDGGHHIVGSWSGHAHRLPIRAGQVDLINAQTAAGAAPVLKDGAVGPTEQLARSHAELAAAPGGQHLPRGAFHRDLAVGVHRGDQIRRRAQLLETHPIPHGEGLPVCHGNGIKGRLCGVVAGRRSAQ